MSTAPYWGSTWCSWWWGEGNQRFISVYSKNGRRAMTTPNNEVFFFLVGGVYWGCFSRWEDEQTFSWWGMLGPPPPQTPIPHFYWSKGGYSQLNPDPNIWFTEVVTGGYWGLLWLENYVVWIVLEPWLNTFRCMPLTCKVLINFKWAIGGHLHHNVTFVFVPKWIMAVDYYAQVI